MARLGTRIERLEQHTDMSGDTFLIASARFSREPYYPGEVRAPGGGYWGVTLAVAGETMKPIDPNSPLGRHIIYAVTYPEPERDSWLGLWDWPLIILRGGVSDLGPRPPDDWQLPTLPELEEDPEAGQPGHTYWRLRQSRGDCCEAAEDAPTGTEPRPPMSAFCARRR